MTYRIGVDVGGTFTDVVCVAADGTTTLAKAASTPADQSEGVVAGLAVLAEKLGVKLPDLLRQTERIVHGTTVATNALLERKGAKIAMLTTEGHRDVIEMREGLKPWLRRPLWCRAVCAFLYGKGCARMGGWKPHWIRHHSMPPSRNCARRMLKRSQCVSSIPGAMRGMKTPQPRLCARLCRVFSLPPRPRCCRRSRNLSGFRRQR
jgi:hypothetical protein